MREKNILNEIKTCLSEISYSLSDDFDNIHNLCPENEEDSIVKLKSKKLISDTIGKIINAFIKLNKLSDLENHELEENEKHDLEIIKNFLEKHGK